jgi:type III secretory pathway component EscR
MVEEKHVVVSTVLLNVGMASTHLVKQSTSMTMYLFPLMDGGWKVMKSIPHLHKGLAVMTGCRRAS